jgi:hypothetical protein
MKKILFVLVLMLSASIIASAQFKFGVKAAANFATTNGEGDEMKVGFSGGVLGQVKFSERWALQPEVLFNMQGPKGTVNGVDVKTNLAYVAIPVMVQLHVAEGFFVEAGPQLGILVSAKLKASSGSNSASVDVKEGFETVEGALNMGAGYELQNIPLGFFARSSIGLTSVTKKGYGDPDLRNLSFQLGAFVKF